MINRYQITLSLGVLSAAILTLKAIQWTVITTQLEALAWRQAVSFDFNMFFMSLSNFLLPLNWWGYAEFVWVTSLFLRYRRELQAMNPAKFHSLIRIIGIVNFVCLCLALVLGALQLHYLSDAPLQIGMTRPQLLFSALRDTILWLFLTALVWVADNWHKGTWAEGGPGDRPHEAQQP